MMRAWRCMGVIALTVCLGGGARDPLPPVTLRADDIRSGSVFLTPETQALQEDDFANPGFLWVDRGRDLFTAEAPHGPACASCHTEEDLSGAATRFPTVQKDTGQLVNLEGQINQCREDRQQAPVLTYESENLLALTAYVASLSRGLPTAIEVTPENRSFYEAGRAYYTTRRGQLNLACTQCHDDNWGRRLRGDVISQGHGNGFPAYRLEWQTLGSLHRRLRECDIGVRAEPYPAGSSDYLALELYLAVRGLGLPVETPAVRR